MADSIGFISGTGAIIHPNIIISSAQHFEGYVFCLFSEKTIWRATHTYMIFQHYCISKLAGIIYVTCYFLKSLGLY